MSQYEQENDLGRGGGEVDEEIVERGEEAAAERRSSANVDSSEEPEPGPWAKTSSGDADEI